MVENFGNDHCQNSAGPIPLELLAGLLQISKALYEIYLRRLLRG